MKHCPYCGAGVATEEMRSGVWSMVVCRAGCFVVLGPARVTTAALDLTEMFAKCMQNALADFGVDPAAVERMLPRTPLYRPEDDA